MSRQRKKSKAVPVVILLFILVAALCVGCFYAENIVDAMRKEKLTQVQESVEAANSKKEQKYAAELAEYQQKINKKPDTSWPEHKQDGWDLLVLDNYPLENQITRTMTRAETMNNGMLLVNPWHKRPDDFDEAGITALGSHYNWKLQVNDGSVSLFLNAADAFKAAVDAAAAENANLTHYTVSEAYRSWNTQNEMFEKAKTRLASKYSGEALEAAAAKEVNAPGTSEFNTGLAFRVRLYDRENAEVGKGHYSTSDQGIWMNENCWKYGLIFRFPLNSWPLPESTDKSFVTGISSQQNIYRYVGVPHATIMHYMDFCLEDYIQYLQEHPHLAFFEDGVLKYEIYRQYVGDAASFDVILNNTSKITKTVTSLDNMGYVITSFEY